jgi:DNA phosphorothioation-dependent restriction protein DptG
LNQLYNFVFGIQNDFVRTFLREISRESPRLRKAMGDIIAEKKSMALKAKKIIDNGKKRGVFRDVNSRHAIISFVGMNLGYLVMASFVNSI